MKRGTKRERGQALLYSDFTPDELNDPLVVGLANQLKQRDQEDTSTQAPDFSNVRGSATTVPQEPSLYDRLKPIDDWGQNMGDILNQGLQGGVGSALGAGTFAKGDVTNAIGGGPLQVVLNTILGGPNLLDLADPTGKARMQIGGEMYTRSQQQKQAAVDLARATKPLGSETASVAMADVAGSPTNLASLFGGPAGAALAGGDTFLEQYTQNRLQGAGRMGSMVEALPQAAIEGTLEHFQAGDFATKIPLVKKVLGEATLPVKGSLERFVKRSAANMIGEGTEEAITTAAQAASDYAISKAAPNTDAGRAAQQNLPRNLAEFGNQVIRSAAAGALGAGSMGSPLVHFQNTTENAMRMHDLLTEAAKRAKPDNVKTEATPEEDVAPSSAVPATPTASPIQSFAEANKAAIDTINKMTEGESKPITSKPQKKGGKKKVLSDMEKFANRKMEGGETTSDLSASDVLTAMTKNVGSQETGILHGLIKRGNLQVVDDASQIPDNAQPLGTKGFYDGKTTYVVANQIDPNNVVGDVLDTAAHEIHHAAQASGAVKISSFVGDDSANQLVNKIEKLAQAGDPTSQKIIDAAKNSEEQNPGSYRDEVLGYAVTAQRAARNTNTLFGRTVNNIVSSVRSNLGVNANLSDVAHLSDKLLQRAAVSDKSFAALGIAPDSVVGRNMMIPDLRGKVSDRHFYSIDGTHKFEISDRDSNLRGDVIDKLRKQGVDAQTTVGQLLNHPRLYKALNDVYGSQFLKDMPVLFRPLGPRYLGMFSESQNSIILNSDFLQNPDAAQWNGPIHRVLIHEMQHVIQHRGGSQAGTNAHYIATQQHPDMRRLNSVIQAQQDKVDNGRKILDTFDRIMNHKDTDPKERQALARNRAKAELAFQQDRGKLQDLQKQQQDIIDAHFPAYESALGEREARRAEHRIPRSQETIDAQQPGAHEGEYLANGVNDDAGNIMEPKTPEHLQAMQDFANAGEESPRGWGRAVSMQNLKDIQEETEQDRRKFTDAVVKWFTNDNVYYGRELNTIKEAASGRLTSLVHKTEVLGTRLKDAVDAAVEKLGLDRTKFETELKDRLDVIDQLGTEDARRSAIMALDKRYPGVGKALADLRDLKLEFSREIIAQRLKDKDRPLSKKESAIFRTIMKNAETYNTRAYLATVDKAIGERYGKNILRTANRDKTSVSAQTVQAAIKYLKNHDLIIPPKAALSEMDFAGLKRIYETWIGKAPKGNKGNARDVMLKRLQAMPAKTQQEIDDKAYSIVKDLLGMTPQTTAIGTYYRGARQNRTILNARRNMPVEIRNLMGEITHPIVREMITLSRMSQLAAKTQMLTDIFTDGKGKWWNETDSKEFPLQLNGEDYGPLDGKFVTARVHDLLSSSVQLEQTLSAQVQEALVHPEKFAGILLGPVTVVGRKASSVYKTTALAYNPYAMVRNWVGSHMMAIQNGLVPGSRDWYMGMHRTAQALTAAQTKRQSDSNLKITNELQKAGVLDSATMGEFKSGFYNDMFSQIAHLDPTAKTFIQQVDDVLKQYIKGRDSKLGKANDTMRSIYAGMDMWVKPATYFNRKAYLKSYYEANGTPKTEEELIREAGYDTNLTNITYTNANPMVKVAERYAAPLTMFLTYYTEVFRAHIGSLAMVARDVQKAREATSPKAAALAYTQATKRLVGTLAVTYGLNAAIMTILGGLSDEEKRKRFLDAAWEKYDLLVNIGKTKDGNEVMLGLSQIDPNGPLNEPMRAILGAKEGDKKDAVLQAAAGLFTQSKTAFSLFHILQDVGVHIAGKEGTELDHPRKRNTQLQQNWPAAYDWMTQHLAAGDVGENSAELLDTIVPGALRPFYKMNSPDKVAEGINKPLGQSIEMMGGNLYVRKPDLDMGFKIRDYTEAVNGLKTEFKNFISNQNNLSVPEAVEELQKLRSREFHLYQGLNDAWSGYTAYEPSTAQMKAEMDDNRLFASTKRALRHGGFESEVVSSKALHDWYKKQSKGLSYEERTQLHETYITLRDAYSQMESSN